MLYIEINAIFLHLQFLLYDIPSDFQGKMPDATEERYYSLLQIGKLKS